jgi:hypothetical protein
MNQRTILTSIACLLFVTNVHAQLILVPTVYPTVQAGINAASTGDTVLVADGIYFENIRFNGKAITVASHFILNHDPAHITNTVLNGGQPTNTDSGAVVMFVHGEDTSSVLMGFTLTGGSGVKCVQYTPEIRAGGGIFSYNSGSKLIFNKIVNNIITSDTAAGAGVFCYAEQPGIWTLFCNNNVSNNGLYGTDYMAFAGGAFFSTNTVAKNNLIESNICSNNYAYDAGFEFERNQGVGNISILCEGNIIRGNQSLGLSLAHGGGLGVWDCDIHIFGNTIEGNMISSGGYSRGGGLYLVSINNPAMEVIIQNNSITNNTADSGVCYGAGICARFVSPSIINNVISMNRFPNSTDRYGAGLYLFKPTLPMIIRNNNFSNNTGPFNASTGRGGAICVWEAFNSEVLVEGNVFEGNTAWFGGGIYARSSYNILIINNVFAKDTAKFGGAIGIYHPGSKENIDGSAPCITIPQIFNNTFVHNRADAGGALLFQGYTNAPVISNSIFNSNFASSVGRDIRNVNTDTIRISYSNINTGFISGPWSGKGNIPTNPLFVASGTHPYALQPASPCIDAGLPDVFGLLIPPWDILGNPRIIDGNGDSLAVIDIGAYEYGATNIGVQKPNQVAMQMKVRCLPNPFRSDFEIELDTQHAGPHTFSLTDISGKSIRQWKSDFNEAGLHRLTCDVSGIANGVYLLTVTSSNHIAWVKLVRSE